MDLSILSSVTEAQRTTAAKAWSSALTSLVTAGATWGIAYTSGANDPSLVGAVHEAANNLFVVTLTVVLPAVLSFYVTYAVPNKPKDY